MQSCREPITRKNDMGMSPKPTSNLLVLALGEQKKQIPKHILYLCIIDKHIIIFFKDERLETTFAAERGGI